MKWPTRWTTRREVALFAIAKRRHATRSTGFVGWFTSGSCRRRWMRRKPLFPPPPSAATGKRKRHKGRQPYSVLTINGRVRLRRVRWHCPEEGSESPIDRLLDQTERTISEGVREMACRVNQGASSFAKAAEDLSRTAHIDVSKETLRQLVEGEGKAVVQAMRQGELAPDWSATDCTTPQQTTRVYLGCDGVKVPLVTDEE
ncbi:MAG: hypothetical protein DRP79_07275, partial [Planctomycetota bacterium]